MTVLVLVAPGSEEIETVAIVDTLVRARIEVLLSGGSAPDPRLPRGTAGR
ncbi:hypothetical protein OEJJJPPD_01602 [Aeromonas salmonicida]